MYGNRSEEDIMMRKKLEAWSRKHAKRVGGWVGGWVRAWAGGCVGATPFPFYSPHVALGYGYGKGDGEGKDLKVRVECSSRVLGTSPSPSLGEAGVLHWVTIRHR